MISIIDYGLGNVGAFANVYKRLNIPTVIVRQPEELEGATHVILPGVGAFDHAMELLDASGLRPVLSSLVGSARAKLLGVCVGMQMLADSSEEGEAPGLGWVPGRVRAFAGLESWEGLPLPHMGWNDVHATGPGPLLAGMESDARFYFLHSYFFEAASEDHIAARASYGSGFACMVRRDHVFGVQFHPEKSHHWGVNLLKNFAAV
ncbi:MAG: imidazole glycerol phosphate synthase subunit HisH [Bryobacterales bacterium]|nr:imidazole glycerol phosphate synthase subunit HisH [Bryobacterales bacterium]